MQDRRTGAAGDFTCLCCKRTQDARSGIGQSIVTGPEATAMPVRAFQPMITQRHASFAPAGMAHAIMLRSGQFPHQTEAEIVILKIGRTAMPFRRTDVARLVAP